MSNKQFSRIIRHFSSLENETQFSIECTPKQLTITSKVNKEEGYPDFAYRQLPTTTPPSTELEEQKRILCGEGISIQTTKNIHSFYSSLSLRDLSVLYNYFLSNLQMNTSSLFLQTMSGN